MMYIFLTKTDGLKVAVDMSMVMMIEDIGDARVLITPYCEIEVVEEFKQILNISDFKINLN